MKVCVVSASYQEGLGYQENIWAQELVKNGYQVLVVTAGGRRKTSGRVLACDRALEVVRVPTWRLSRGLFLCRDDGPVVEQFDPDLVLWFGPGQHFGKALLGAQVLEAIPVVTFFSEGYYQHEYDWRKSGIGLKQRLWALGYQTLRGGIVRAACRRSALIVGDTPETQEILLLSFPSASEREEVGRKIVHMPLGFDVEQYRFDKDVRQRTRKELGFGPDDVVVCMSTRFASTGKKARLLNVLVPGIQEGVHRCPDLKAVIVGFAGDPVSERYRRRIVDGTGSRRIICHDFADQVRLNEIYNACDIVVFGSASISCQAALGTGLFGCFASDASMDHLIGSPDLGVFFRFLDQDDLAEKLVVAAEMIAKQDPLKREELRRCRAEANRWLGYDQIVDTVLSRVMSICPTFSGKSENVILNKSRGQG